MNNGYADGTHAPISLAQLSRFERLLPPLVLISASLIVISASSRGWTAALAALFFVGNYSFSHLRNAIFHRASWIERVRFLFNLPVLSATMYFAGPASPAWLFCLPGAIWVPLAIREKWLAWTMIVSFIGLTIGDQILQAPDTAVARVAIPPLMLAMTASISYFLIRAAAASERASVGHILESVRSTVFTCDVTGTIKYLNRSVTPLTREVVLGANIMDFTPEHDRRRVQNIASGVIHSGQPAAYDVDAFPGETGQLFRVYLSPMILDGVVHGLVFVLTDITDQKRLERDLVNARDRAERLSRARFDFLAVVNHEVRTPVNALLAGVTLLETALPRLNREERDLLLTMQKSGLHLRAQVNSLLDMSRFTHKKEQLKRERFDLRVLVDEMLAMYSLQLAPGVSLSSRVEPELPCHVYSDPQRWQTILRNLLSNAAKFTQRGSISLEIAWAEETRSALCLTVQDTGRGIVPEHQALIFEPFTQFPAGGVREQGGVGLGLSLCGANVHLLGGTIRVESKVGEGTRFTCVLPVAPCDLWRAQGSRGDSCGHCDDAMADGAGSASLASLQSDTGELAQLRILIVEDDAVNRMVLEKLLNREGLIQISLAGTGDEALARMENEQFDVILLDMHLPDRSGTETARSIRARGWKGQMIAVTADTTPDMRDLVFAAGIDYFSPKPLDMSDLMSSIRLGLTDAGRERN